VAIGRKQWAEIGPEDFVGASVVVHAASDLRSSISDNPASVFESELMTTARLLEFMREASVPRLMYVSSCAIYGDADPVEDQKNYMPLTINGQMKLLNENLIAEFCAQHAIRWEAYRVFNLFGGRDHFSIVNRIMRAAFHGEQLTLHNGGRASRDFVHVEDVAAVLLKLLDNPPNHHHVNVGTGKATQIRELIDVAQSLGLDLPLRYVTNAGGVDRSQANIERLTGCIGPYSFKSVSDYLRDAIQSHSQGNSPSI
jgi:nucleoside-diphosphate-sugar epimerase